MQADLQAPTSDRVINNEQVIRKLGAEVSHVAHHLLWFHRQCNVSLARDAPNLRIAVGGLQLKGNSNQSTSRWWQCMEDSGGEGL